MSVAATDGSKFKSPLEIPPQLGRPFPEYVAGYMFEVLLYGINIMLFIAAVYTLLFKTKASARWLLLFFAVLMFSIATANVSASLSILFGFIIRGKPPIKSINRAKQMFFCINTILQDALLIYRCYSVWSHSKYIIAIPCIYLLGSSITGFVVFGQAGQVAGWRKIVFLWLSLVFNVSMTTLMATRIWWMGRKAQKVLGGDVARRYYPAMAIIIESGAIYSLYVFIDQVLAAAGARSFIADAGVPQVVVIAPTLIIVQVGLGRHIRDLQTTIRLNQESSVLLSTVQLA